MERSYAITRSSIFNLIIFLCLFVSCLYTASCFAKNPPSKYSYTTPRHSYKGEKAYVEKTTYICKNCTTMRLFGSLMGGGAWARVGQSQSFTDDTTLYSYDANTNTQSKGLWGASVGEELQFYSNWAVQVGLAYYQAASFEAKGTVTQGVDPDADNIFNYQYAVTARQYLFETKFLGDMTNGLYPYLTLGIGASFNSVKDYDVTVNSPTFTPQYASNTNINFSYAIGVGVDYQVVKYARVGLGYRYGWFGNANTGQGEINTVDISNSLVQNNLNLSIGIVQLTFLI